MPVDGVLLLVTMKSTTLLLIMALATGSVIAQDNVAPEEPTETQSVSNSITMAGAFRGPAVSLPAIVPAHEMLNELYSICHTPGDGDNAERNKRIRTVIGVVGLVFYIGTIIYMLTYPGFGMF